MEVGLTEMPEIQTVPELLLPPVDILDEINDQTVTEINGNPTVNGLGASADREESTIASGNAVEIAFIFSGFCLKGPDMDILSKSDPFLRISRIVETGGSVTICQTEVQYNGLFGIGWKPLLLNMEQYGSRDNPLLIECFDFDRGGHQQLIGKIEKSLADLEILHRERVGTHFVLPHSIHHEEVMMGQLFVDGFVVKERNNFPDYSSIFSRFDDFNSRPVIDFTSSNGNILDNPDFICNTDPSGRLNAYLQAITEVSRRPSWGFGGMFTDRRISPYSGSQAYNRQMEAAMQKMIDEAIKRCIDAVILRNNGEETRIDIDPNNNIDALVPPTSGNKVHLMKEVAESTLHKVNEIVLAASAQVAFSLIAYALINSPSSSKLAADSPALLGVVGANAVAFTTSLTSLCLRAKKPAASSFLAKVGAIAVTTAVIGAMATYIPVNIQWLATLATVLPVLAVLYA